MDHLAACCGITAQLKKERHIPDMMQTKGQQHSLNEAVNCNSQGSITVCSIV